MDPTTTPPPRKDLTMNYSGLWTDNYELNSAEVVWVVTQWNDIVWYQRFGGPWCLHLQGEDGRIDDDDDDDDDNVVYFFALISTTIDSQWTHSSLGWIGFHSRKHNKYSSLHHRVQNGSGAHPASYPMGIRNSSPGGKAAGAWSWPLTSI
jgi:hypothetical protein